MDRNTGLPFAGGNDRLVHVYPVHAFASVFRQKCRMNIDNLTRIGIQQGIGDLIHEAGKDNQIRIIFRKLCQDRRPICKFLPSKRQKKEHPTYSPGHAPTFRLLDKTTATLIVSLLGNIGRYSPRSYRPGSKKLLRFSCFLLFCAQEKKKCAVFRIFSSLNLFCNIKILFFALQI